ncbi:hypothetical protein EXN23_03625 [Agrobacterium salinitolerans]|uniref:Uncharacterized protein n=1 Tax=Agrobacterium salinitolerans TaxID=1183413 RepID=A0ABY3BT92_9HYPH|nr:hypothetical protein EXN23_03625 [Agrobacterium salinitolerans]
MKTRLTASNSVTINKNARVCLWWRSVSPLFNSTLFANAKYPTLLIPFLPLQSSTGRHSLSSSRKRWISRRTVFLAKLLFFHCLKRCRHLSQRPVLGFADHGNRSSGRIVIDKASYRDILL